jgi:DnaK suppressor protein
MMRKMLIELRQRLSQQVSMLKDASLYRNDQVITGEEGTDVFDRQFALNLASSEQEAIHDIDDAIRRIDEGTYGVCEDCGCVIGRARLKALPFVRSCMQCQSEKERNRPHFRPFV